MDREHCTSVKWLLATGINSASFILIKNSTLFIFRFHPPSLLNCSPSFSIYIASFLSALYINIYHYQQKMQHCALIRKNRSVKGEVEKMTLPVVVVVKFVTNVTMVGTILRMDASLDATHRLSY